MQEGPDRNTSTRGPLVEIVSVAKFFKYLHPHYYAAIDAHSQYLAATPKQGGDFACARLNPSCLGIPGYSTGGFIEIEIGVGRERTPHGVAPLKGRVLFLGVCASALDQKLHEWLPGCPEMGSQQSFLRASQSDPM